MKNEKPISCKINIDDHLQVDFSWVQLSTNTIRIIQVCEHSFSYIYIYIYFVFHLKVCV